MTEKEIVATPIPGNGKVQTEQEPVFSHPVGPYQVLRLLPADPYTRKLFPKFVDRCIGFVERTGSDTDEIWLGNLLYSNFFQATNYIHCLVVIDEIQRRPEYAISKKIEYKRPESE